MLKDKREFKFLQSKTNHKGTSYLSLYLYQEIIYYLYKDYVYFNQVNLIRSIDNLDTHLIVLKADIKRVAYLMALKTEKASHI